ncbi:extracellular solute-binding protein [Paenibacillus sp. FSL H7-0331]|uniref:extracellular solute-binding protein n=1 Tax=Paenibacillus sp. FSL H7-0331 TaxID=1920421 RepID=UPI00096F142D|nr:extracellular solute-binding protein [Paenibacillus sp. FSL H7-0331]OMF08806.1 hypothetical protein BK127_28110 [Paenibacillus sp. FSL H7-0331]
MKRINKKWVLSISLMMATGVVLAGCSQETAKTQESISSSPANKADPYETLPKKVSISMFDRGQVSSDEGTYENNRWVKFIKEQSGIDVSIVPVPRNQAQDKLNVLVASQQAPDLIWEYDRTYIGKLITQGAVQPIDEYIEKYSTSYKKYLQENPHLKPYLTFDGKMYAVATERALDTVANHGIWIRKDWLDKLNLKAPTTMEELIEVAQAFKNKDPDGNGKSDTTPIVGSYSYTFEIFSAMNAAVNNQWYVEDGKMKYGATLDRFGDAIALEKQFYELGLVDKEFLTDKNSQRAQQLWATGKAGMYMGQWGMESSNKDLLKNIPDAKPIALEPVATKNGKNGLYQETPTFIYVAFNKEMKNPKAAVEYLDWIIEKGWKTLRYGQEGTHYKDVNGVPQTIDAEKNKKEVLYAGEYAVLRKETFKPSDLMVSAAQDPASQLIASLRANALEVAMKNKFRRDTPYQPNFNEINEIQASLRTFLEETRAKAATQGANFTAKWAIGEIRKEWQRLGGDKAEQLAQEWYDKNKANFK